MRVLLLLFVLPLAWAQFPAVCNKEDSLSTKTCCPNNCSTRGTCVSTSTSIMASWESANSAIVGAICDRTTPTFDVRCRWPLRVFDWVCSCNVGWGGYDCSHCDFGYKANADGVCEKMTDNDLLVRRNFKTLSDQERSNYIRVLEAAKNEAEEEKEWAVVVGEPTVMDGRFVLQNVSTYDMFVVQHFLAIRDQYFCSNNVPIDFAHRNSTFSTWHRYYLLIVEREFQRIAERIGVSGFTLAYWDYTPMDSTIFTAQSFGTPDYSGTPGNVLGDLFGTKWPVVCEQHYKEYLKGVIAMNNGDSTNCDEVRKLCNVEMDRSSNSRLKRGFISDLKNIPADAFLPDEESITMALRADDYSGNMGFNSRLEGFVDLCAGENPPCLFHMGGSPPSITINNLHNAVHIYIGGHMRVVPSASNDPIFFLHHANIDRIFERWLRKFHDNSIAIPDYMPMSGEHPGHNFNDSLVPFFPLKTHSDMYKISSELGFRYDSTPSVPAGSDYEMCSIATPDMCAKGGYFPPSDTGGGGTTSSPTSGGGGTTSRPTSGGGGTSPDAGTTNFHVPLHLILVAGACAVMTVFVVFSI